MISCVVIGAGVAGLTVATELIERGCVVTIIDRASGHGASQCSWWAGGMLAPWCERESAEQDVVDLGVQSAAWWDHRVSSVRRNGTLVLASGRDTAELKRFARRTSEFERVDGQRIEQMEPDLAGRFAEGLFFPKEAHLDPRKAIKELALRFVEAGGEIRFGADIVPDADRVVDCRGLAARDALPDLRGVKGEMIVLHSSEIRLSRPVRLLHPRHPLYVVPRENGLFMLGATMIESGDRSRVTVRSMLELLGAAYALHPAFAEAEIIETGVDARPAFPDNLPRVHEVGNRTYINGLYRHGFLLSPAMAQRAAEAIISSKRAAS